MADPIYVGTGNHVAAVDRATGQVLWQTRLREGVFKAGHDFVTLLVDEDVIFAHTYGRLYALDREAGQIIWENPLTGLGYGMACLAVEGNTAGVPMAPARAEVDESSGNGGNGGD